MADFTAKMADTLNLKSGAKPPSVTNVRINVQGSSGTPDLGEFDNSDGIFSIATILSGQSPGNFRFRGKFYEYGAWGNYAGTWSTLELVASDPPETADWEITAT